MKHVSIEGMDGVGKTTVCRLLSKRLGVEFVEKPLHLLTDEGDKEADWVNYFRIRDKVNASPDRIFTSWFYGLQYLYLQAEWGDKDIVTDRYILSNYAWSGTLESKPVFELLSRVLRKPDLNVILLAKAETIRARAAKRDAGDADIEKANKAKEIYRKMKEFSLIYHWPSWVIHTDGMTPEEIADLIIEKGEEIAERQKEGELWIETETN
ncbi:MAG: AAA family ATPase [Bacilli bacterium]|nr:AAA family ATPase [Bacilli bacterium]